jgi:HEPN domain-containing protein/predicted nucleotidyltransferase
MVRAMTSPVATLPPDVDAIAARIPAVPDGVRGSREEIAGVVAAIARRFDPEQIVLFGSRAYGEPTSASDVDLMVIMDTPLTTHDQRALIWEAVVPAAPFRPDIHVRTPKQIAIGLGEGDFFIEDVMLKGITLYQRSGAAMTDQVDSSNSADEDAQQSTLKQATQEWIDKAEADLRVARHLFAMPDPEYGIACFHAQQSAEKSLKALLQESEVRFPRTHALVDLAQLAIQEVPGIAFSVDDLSWLTIFGVEVRSPGRSAGDTEARRAIAIAEEVRTVVRKVLGLTNDLRENET